MVCCQCQAIEKVFDRKVAARELATYKDNGVRKSTRLLLEALQSNRIEGKTLLDIGGGIGVIQFELLAAGADHAVSVEASSGFLAVGKGEARSRGVSEKIDYYHGDFVDLAPKIRPVDLVTLDRVLCCYPDVHGLVDNAAQLATHLIGLVYPRDTWWLRWAEVYLNPFVRLFTRSDYRFYIHATSTVERILEARGFTRRSHCKAGIWQIVIFVRSAQPTIGKQSQTSSPGMIS